MNIMQNLFYIVPFASAICNLFLLLIFVTAKKDKLICYFMNLLVAFTVWPLASFFMRIDLYPGVPFWYQVSMISILFVPVYIYGFIHHYTNQRGSFLLISYYFGTFLLVLANLANIFIKDPRIELSETGIYGFNYDLSPLAIIPVFFASIVLLNTAKLIYVSIKKDGFPTASFRPFFMGIIIMCISMVLDTLPGFSAIFPWDPFACMINAILIYYMLYKKHVFKLTQLSFTGSTYLVSTVLTGLILVSYFNSINYVFDTYLNLSQNYKTAITTIAFSFITIIIFNILKILMNNLFVKGEQARETLVKEFNLSVIKTLKRDEILALFTDLVHESTDVETAYIFLHDGQKTNYKMSACTDKMRSKDILIRSDNPLIKWLNTHKTEISYSDFKHTINYKSMWESEKETFESLNTSYIIPIFGENKLIGLVIISKKANKRPYTYSELTFLEALISVFSIALKNSDLYETIQEEARLDSLVNLYNRRYFTEKLEVLFKNNRHNAISLILISFDNFKLYNELYGSNDGDEMLKKFADILTQTLGSRGLIGRYGGKEFCICLPVCSDSEAELIVEELRDTFQSYIDAQCESTKRFLTFTAGICSYPTSASNYKELLTYANMAVYAGKMSGKNKTIIYSLTTDSGDLSPKSTKAIGQEYASTIYALTAAIDAKDHYTFSHSENVSYLATQLAQAIGLDAEHIEIIRQAGLLHDIGKISIPETILTKTSRLTSDEYTIMKSHVENSIDIIRHLPSLDYVVPIAISHHERYDGNGYPRGLSGEDIPIGGRCLGIADAFDAIVSRRPYKDPVSIPDALLEIERNLGKQFDPVLGQTFVDLVRAGQINLDIYNQKRRENYG